MDLGPTKEVLKKYGPWLVGIAGALFIIWKARQGAGAQVSAAAADPLAGGTLDYGTLQNAIDQIQHSLDNYNPGSALNATVAQQAALTPGQYATQLHGLGSTLHSIVQSIIANAPAGTAAHQIQQTPIQIMDGAIYPAQAPATIRFGQQIQPATSIAAYPVSPGAQATAINFGGGPGILGAGTILYPDAAGNLPQRQPLIMPHITVRPGH